MRSAWFWVFGLLTVASPAAGDLLTNGNFETVLNTTGPLPDACGYWQGNNSEIVGASSGITPAEGTHMLQFINTFTGPDGDWGATQCNIYQLVDLSPFAGLIQTGTATVTLSAAFNRVVGDSQTDTSFYAGMLAYAGSPSDFPTQWSQHIAGNGMTVFTDSSLVTWQPATATMLLPAATTYLAVALGATENVYNDLQGVEFDGHFADAVSLVIGGISGDLNCDGSVNFGDINPFVLLLTNHAAWVQQFAGCDWHVGDCNGDGWVDFADINPFVAILTGN
jgi:hypothetical protein